MIRAMTEQEVSERQERVLHLYQSKWLVDNLTAILMDSNRGGSGLDEFIARNKAHQIIDWIEFKKQLIPNEAVGVASSQETGK